MTTIDQAPAIADPGSAVAAQAKVRAMFGVPIMVTVLVYLWYSHNVSDWVRVVTIVNSIYIVMMLLWAGHPRLLSANQVLLGTAILDEFRVCLSARREKLMLGARSAAKPG